MLAAKGAIHYSGHMAEVFGVCLLCLCDARRGD